MGLNLENIDPRHLLRQLQNELCTESFREFIAQVKPDFQFSWHHERIIDALQRLADREFSCLILMVPPRHGKSELVSRLFPAWCFARNKNEQVILASYSADLAGSMGRDCKRIMSGHGFIDIFPDIKPAEQKAVGQVNTNKRFDINGAKGYYISAGVGGGITGVGATVAIIDDPVKNAAEADSKTYRDKVWEWYTTTFKTRFEPGCIQLVCQTRWHEDDLTGRILKNNEPGVEIISFPAIAEKAEPDRKAGEALWPEKYNLANLREKMSTLGSRSWGALFQQRPAPQEGNVIKRDWFRYYNPREYSLKGKKVNFYVDTAYTDDEKNDPTAILAYVREGADYYIIDCLSEWHEFTEQVNFVKSFTKRNNYTPISIVRVEPKATGKSLVQVMKKATALNIKEAIAPKENKLARVNSVSAIIEAGRVFLPEGMAWVEKFLDECAAFPNAPHDDQVDCLTGMIINETTIKSPGGRFK